MSIKIGDFGFAKELNSQTELTASFGTPIYMAPEVLSKQPYDSKADIWSLGVTMFNILTGGHYPFSSDNRNSILQSIQFCGEYGINSNLELSFECLDFMAHCL